MMSVVRILTKADTYLWLKSLYDQAEPEEALGLSKAMNSVFRNRYYMDRIGSVLCSSDSACSRQGFCAVDDTAYHTVDQLVAGVRAELEQEIREELQQEYDEAKNSLNRLRLRLPLADNAQPENVLTTILPLCSVCWAVDNLHLDHVVPKSKGGANDYSNYQLLCQPCNSSKNDKEMWQWHTWVNESEDEGAVKIRTRREENRKAVLERENQ